MHLSRSRPAAPARARTALAELDAIEREARTSGDHLAASIARRARQGVERRVTSPASAAA